MTVKELKKLLNGVNEDMLVLIPMNSTFDGYFKSPCLEESGVSELGICDEEEEQERKLLNKPTTEPSFCLVPCGFYEVEENDKCSLN